MEIFQEEKNGKLVVKLKGRLNELTVAKFDEEMVTILSGPYDYLIFDFSELSYLSGAGLNVLLKAQKNLYRIGKALILVCVKDCWIKIMEDVGYDKYFIIEEGLEQALNQKPKEKQQGIKNAFREENQAGSLDKNEEDICSYFAKKRLFSKEKKCKACKHFEKKNYGTNGVCNHIL